MTSSYFASTGLTICALVFLILIAILISNKITANAIETKCFIGLLSISLILLVLEMVNSYTLSLGSSYDTLNLILMDIYVVLSFYWEELFLAYTFFLLQPNYQFKKGTKAKITWILVILFAILFPILIILFLDTSFYCMGEGLPYVITGGAVYSLHVLSVAGTIGVVFLMAVNVKKIKNLYLAPFYFASGVFILTFLLQEVLGFDLNESGFFFALVVTILYFTVESQDSKLVDNIEQARKEAEQASKAKTEFLMNISHEIRTPLNTILGFSESLLAEEHLTQEVVKRDADSIYTASVNLLDLINNILDISRIESGKEEVDEKNYNLGNVIFEINSFVPAKIVKNDLKFSIDVNEDIPADFYGDSSKIYKIVTLILLNAIEYTNYGEVKLNIDGNTTEDGMFELTFHVSNTGHAMKQEYFAKDFDDFIKTGTGDDATFDGTSLGVVIAKKLTSILGGDIQFINETGKGTQYIIKVKQKIVDTNKLGNIFEKSINKVSSSKDMISCLGKKALVVDDNRVNIKIAARLLERFNFEVEGATSGSECLVKVKEGAYDIIFLDHMMPEMDGIETIKALKSSGIEIPPVIALTANAYDGLRNEYLAQGFTDYLAKPIDFKALSKLINKLFGREV